MQTETSYLGLQLPHPFIAGASPLGYSLDALKRLEDAGCAAVVLPSLFEEQITLEEEGRVAGVSVYDAAFAEIFAQFPEPDEYALQPHEYAEHVHRAKSALSIPVIASLNGRTKESWLKYAAAIQEAGADALELNMYQVVTDLNVSGMHVESQLVGVVEALKDLLRIPIAVKLSPFFTATANVARRLADAGADGLVLFNRFYQPDIDINGLTAVSRVELSDSSELLLRIRWVAILHGRIQASLAVSGGVATPADGIKALLAGADVVQLVSAILRHGPAYIATMRSGLEEWLARQQDDSLEAIKGVLSLQTRRDPGAFERAHYIKILQSWTK
jgi:dihydroorotate dehydrogenase (fumarate)